MNESGNEQQTGFEIKVFNEVRARLGLALEERFGQGELRPRIGALFDRSDQYVREGLSTLEL